VYCSECGITLKPGMRVWELTVGEIEENLEGEPFFEPSEHTEHRCAACMGEQDIVEYEKEEGLREE
jgi:hypothetical protein